MKTYHASFLATLVFGAMIMTTTQRAAAWENPQEAQAAIETIRDFYLTIDDPAKSAQDVGAFFGEGYIDHGRSPNFPAEMKDAEAHEAFFAGLKAAFTNPIHDIEVIEVTGEDMVLAYWTFRGEHTGDMFGIPASGATVNFRGIDLYTIEGDKIVEQRHVVDIAGLMAQIAPR